jgi:hypothetical protein
VLKNSENFTKLERQGQKTASKDVLITAIPIVKGENMIISKNKKDLRESQIQQFSRTEK